MVSYYPFSALLNLIEKCFSGIFSPSDDRILGPSPRGADSCSPASTSLSPQPQNSSVKEESMDTQISEDGEHHSRTTDTDSPGIQEETRGFRSKYASVLIRGC